MKVILLERITGLGAPGDLVTVKSGYGRNFLLPGKKAIPANKENMERYEAEKTQILAAEESKKASAQSVYEQLNGQSFEIVSAVTEENTLYGSVSARDIVSAAAEKGVEISANDIDLPNGPIHALGEFEVNVHCHMEVSVPLRITVVAQDEAK